MLIIGYFLYTTYGKKIGPFHCAPDTRFAGEEAEPPLLRLRGLALSSTPAGVKCLPLHSTIEVKIIFKAIIFAKQSNIFLQ